MIGVNLKSITVEEFGRGLQIICVNMPLWFTGSGRYQNSVYEPTWVKEHCKLKCHHLLFFQFLFYLKRWFFGVFFFFRRVTFTKYIRENEALGLHAAVSGYKCESLRAHLGVSLRSKSSEALHHFFQKLCSQSCLCLQVKRRESVLAGQKSFIFLFTKPWKKCYVW